MASAWNGQWFEIVLYSSCYEYEQDIISGTNGALIRPDGTKIIVGPQTEPLWWGPNFPNQACRSSLILFSGRDDAFAD